MTQQKLPPSVRLVVPYISRSARDLHTQPGVWLEHHLFFSPRPNSVYNLELPGTMDEVREEVNKSIALVLVAVVSHPGDLAAFKLAADALVLTKPECTYLLLKRVPTYRHKPGDITKHHLKQCAVERAKLRRLAKELGIPVLTSAASDFWIVNQTLKAMHITCNAMSDHYDPRY